MQQPRKKTADVRLIKIELIQKQIDVLVRKKRTLDLQRPTYVGADAVERVNGRILNVLNDGLLLFEARSNTVVHVKVNPEGHVDNEVVNGYCVPIGTYKYAAVSGTLKTVRSYKIATGYDSHLKALNQHRDRIAVIQQDIDRLNRQLLGL